MKNESQDWSCSHMKRHLPCATQQKAASKILPLPRKMNLMIDPSHIWNVIYNARCNKCQPPTSPNIAPATQNESHDWSVSHMTFHLSIDPAHIWNVIYHARRNKRQPPPSQNTAPATQNESHDWSVSYMKGHLQCAVQQESASNSTKYCARHEKWVSGLILLTFETSFTMRGATALTFQPHQIMRLPRKMTRMMILLTCETSFTMRGATALTLQPHQILRLPRKIAFQNMKNIYWKRLKRHLQCAADLDPSMKLQNWTRLFVELTFLLRQRI